MVSVLTLYIEMVLDVTGLVMGTVVLKRSWDNKLQRAWGLLTVTLSLLLLCDNIWWIYLFSRGVDEIPRFTEVPMNHLSIWHIVRVVVFFQFFSLFPLASLRPGWMTAARLVNLCLPIFFISLVACCYEWFNGEYTELKSFADIRANITRRDVIVRITLFVISVITPSVNFLFPFLKRWVPFRRKQNRAMNIYLFCFVMIMSGYIWLMLGTSGLCFNVFGLIVIIPAICLNILYLKDENPLSLPPLPEGDLKSEDIAAVQEIAVSPVVLELSNRMKTFMKEQIPFTNPQYALEDLLRDLDTNEHRLNKVLHYNGFSGFRDYINFNRLQYFKSQAILYKEWTIKELMFKSGFTSRSSFYRYFTNIEKISPGEFMEMLNRQE